MCRLLGKPGEPGARGLSVAGGHAEPHTPSPSLALRLSLSMAVLLESFQRLPGGFKTQLLLGVGQTVLLVS